MQASPERVRARAGPLFVLGRNQHTERAPVCVCASNGLTAQLPAAVPAHPHTILKHPEERPCPRLSRCRAQPRLPPRGLGPPETASLRGRGKEAPPDRMQKETENLAYSINPERHIRRLPGGLPLPEVGGVTWRKRLSGACPQQPMGFVHLPFRHRVPVTSGAGRGGRDGSGKAGPSPGGGERGSRWSTSRTVSGGRAAGAAGPGSGRGFSHPRRGPRSRGSSGRGAAGRAGRADREAESPACGASADRPGAGGRGPRSPWSPGRTGALVGPLIFFIFIFIVGLAEGVLSLGRLCL